MDLQDTPYIPLLKQFPDFDEAHSGTDGLPEFTYMGPESAPLVELRERFRIADKVAGLSEVDAMLTLLEWIYSAFPYDGYAANPKSRDALSILSDPQPYNCFIKSLVLNEVYLSMGFRSRMLLCYPADFDHDNHVVTMVYAETLGKWISVDPSQNTYFMSDDGTILNAIEARAIYAAGGVPRIRHIDRPVEGPLVCGGIPCESYDEFYRIYMSKDCFRFACLARSEYRYDAQPGLEFVYLSPLGYDQERGAEYDHQVSGMVRPHYTHDAAYFLAVPPGRASGQ